MSFQLDKEVQNDVGWENVDFPGFQLYTSQQIFVLPSSVLFFVDLLAFLPVAQHRVEINHSYNIVKKYI